MLRQYRIVTLCALASVFAGQAMAADLQQVYQQALKQDPTYHRAHATWLLAKENHTMAYLGNGNAGSGLAPNIKLSATMQRERTNITGSHVTTANARNYFNSTDYSLQLTQPIFHADTWSQIAGSAYDLRAATASYLYAGQQLMRDSAAAYFKVLQQADTLQYAMANEVVLKSALSMAQSAYKNGLVAKTDIYDARAAYDLAKATVIEQRTQLKNDQESLAAMTNQHYTHLRGLPRRLPVLTPKPLQISAWVDRAVKQNYSLKAQRQLVLSAHNQIRTKRSLFLPTIDATAGYTYDKSPPSLGADATSKHAAVGLSVSMPLFEGGYRFSATRQARYSYLQASDQQQYVYRQLRNSTRSDYWQVASAKQLIEAAHQSVISARQQLIATQVAYRAGVKTMVDVLSAVSNVFKAVNQWSNYRYAYLNHLLALKQDAGTLSPKDLTQVNAWLGDSVNLASPNLTQWATKLGVPKALIKRYLSSKKVASRPKHKRVVRRQIVKNRRARVSAKKADKPHGHMSVTTTPQRLALQLPVPVA